jgi:hypothetical protein
VKIDEDAMITGVVKSDEGQIRLKVKGVRGREQEVETVIEKVYGRHHSSASLRVSSRGLDLCTLRKGGTAYAPARRRVGPEDVVHVTRSTSAAPRMACWIISALINGTPKLDEAMASSAQSAFNVKLPAMQLSSDRDK